MEIREYKESDLDDLLQTWELASKIGHPFLSEEFLNSERLNIPGIYLKCGETWVAQIDKSVVGFTTLHDDEVGALFVHPKVQGTGVGYALMRKACAIRSDLKVEVFKENFVARNFYSNFGFTFIREYLHQESGMTMLCLQHKKVS